MRRIAVVLVVGALLAACGGGGDDDASTPEVDRSDVEATLKVRDEAAQHKARAASDFAPAEDGQELAAGDVLRTNGTGFVEVNYRDGSLTRLDSDAEFTVTALSSTGDAQRVAGHLEVGRAWSSVEDLVATDGSYEITTPVATAAVRGTLFDIDCTAMDRSCTFRVAEGIVRVTPTDGEPIDLEAGDILTVHVDGTTTRSASLTLDRLQADPWMAENVRIDEEETGRVPSGLPDQAEDETASAALAGTWTVTRTVTESTNPLQPVGNVSEVTYELTETCSATSCSVELDAGGIGGAFQKAVLTFAGDHFEGQVTGESPCRDEAGNELSVSPITGTVTISPVAEDPARFTGVLRVTIGASPGCGERTSTFELAGVKQAG